MIDNQAPAFHTDRPLAFGTAQVLSLGALAGALEAVTLAASLELPLSTGTFFVLGVLDVLVMAGFALVVGLVAGAIGFARRADDPVPIWSWQFAAVALALTGWYLGFEAAARIDRGDPIVGAVALAAMPIGFAGLAYYNARFWFRWVERRGSPWGWTLFAWAGSAGLVLMATIGYALRDGGGGQGFDDDRSAVIVTIDGLSASDLAQTPTIGALGSGATGVTFTDAVTPIPLSRAANATVVTGLHPLRHQVFAPDDTMSPRYPTLFSELRDEWQTAGFVSGLAVDGTSGVGHGLHVLDDALSSSAWLGRIDVLGRLQRLIGQPPDHRDAATTVTRFTNWVGRRTGPFVAWVHLDDPAYATRSGEDRDSAIKAVDTALNDLLEGLEAASVRETTLVLVAGTHGADGPGLGEGSIRVPIVLDAPGVDVSVHQVDVQVRLLDIVNTAAEYLELPPIDTSEGLSLLDYATGDRKRQMSVPLVGRSAEGTWLLGLRNNGVKYWTDASDKEVLYLLRDDPNETSNVVADHPDVVKQVRNLLVTELPAMKRLLWH